MAIPDWLKSHGIQHPLQVKFLMAFSSLGMISRAAEAAEIDRCTHYEWLKTDPQYKVAYTEAYERVGDLLEDEAFRRAVYGVAKPVFYEGQECGQVQEYSDSLMALKLKGHLGGKYREKTGVELTGKNGEALRIVVETGVLDPAPKPDAHGTAH